MGDGDGLFLEVYGIPAQAQGLAAPQTVVSGDLDAQLQRIARDGIKQVEHLVLAVERAVVDVLFRTVHLVGRVLGEDVLFYRALERLADDGVVVDDRVCGAAIVQDCLIEVLNMLGRECAELDGRGGKVRDYPGFYHNGVALVGSRGDGGPDTGQPLLHIVHEQDLGFYG